MTITSDIMPGYRGPTRRGRPNWIAPIGLPRGYLTGAVVTATVFWALAALYLIVTPKVFVSRFTLIVPGAGQSTTVSLDTIGQSTTSVNSPYASVSLSPRVVYRELATSDNVRASAAERAGMTYAELGRPRIKLIDETSLMMFEMSGSTAEQAHKKATALVAAFNEQLDILRRDELVLRSDAVTANLKSYKDAVDSARQRITDVQVRSGLVSINQFNEQVVSLSTLRRKIADLTGDLDRLREEQRRLIGRLKIAPAHASAALRLASDPGLAKVVTEYSESIGLLETQSQRLGPAHPTLLALTSRRDAALAKLGRALSSLGIERSETITHLLVSNASHHADLLQQLVKTEALMSGRNEELESLHAERERIETEIATLSSAAASLEDLRKEQLLAEAVYSSALARVDTSKSDLYGAYPIVQVVAPPSIPDGHEQPRRLYALAGGIAGTLFSALAWGLLWLHSYQTMIRRKKRSSSV